VANDLVLLGSRGEGGADFSSGGGSRTASAPAADNFDQRTPEPEHAGTGSSPITDEDIPF
jgi:hypothetical protein